MKVRHIKYTLFEQRLNLITKKDYCLKTIYIKNLSVFLTKTAVKIFKKKNPIFLTTYIFKYPIFIHLFSSENLESSFYINKSNLIILTFVDLLFFLNKIIPAHFYKKKQLPFKYLLFLFILYA